MPIEFGVKAIVDGVGAQRLEEDITAPLPVIDVGLDLAITAKWLVRQELELFYLKIFFYLYSLWQEILRSISS